MLSLNILLVSDEPKLVEACKNSKYINKIYSTFSTEVEGVLNIKYNTFKELGEKCRALQIDMVIPVEEKLIFQGIADVMKKAYVNCIAPTAYWTNLALYHNFARKLLEQYEIPTPPEIRLPVEFPVIVKGDGILEKAYSIQDIISLKEKIYKQTPELAKGIYLEKYLNGKKHKVMSLYDGKNLATFENKNIDTRLLKNYSEKLEKLLNSEKANFTGFINSELIEEDGILYNTGFNFQFEKPEIDTDLLYMLIAITYQKVNELEGIV